MIRKTAKDRFLVDRSLMGSGMLALRQWNDEKDRPSRMKAKQALSRLLTDLGAEPGDEVELTARIVRTADGCPS